MTRTTFFVIALLSLLLLPGLQTALAQTSYVADTIDITLRTGPSNNHKVLRMLPSDEPLEVLEEQESWLQVRTRKGEQGWVFKRYVSKETPKSVQIQKLTKRNEQLEELSGGASGQIDALENEKKSLQEALASIEKEHQELKERHTVLESDAANVLTIKQQHAEDRDKLQKAEADLERISQENRELRTNAYLKWFLSGAGVVFGTWLVGYLMGRKGRQQVSRLY